LSYTVQGWNFSGSWHFQDFRFVLGENIAENVLPAYHLLDFRINYDFELRSMTRAKFRVHVKANNLLNHQYQVIRGFPMPGRNFEVGLQLRFF
jgi:outer membrane receptor protein involved in Fe transport